MIGQYPSATEKIKKIGPSNRDNGWTNRSHKWKARNGSFHSHLLLTALTHSSYLHDARGLGDLPQDYQALEFLGDAVVGFLVSEHLFGRFPDKREGELTKIRASLVSREALAQQE